MLRLFLVYMVIVLIYVSAQVTLPPPLVSRKISYRGENALLIQKAVRMYLAMKKHRPRSAHTYTHLHYQLTHSPPTPLPPSSPPTHTHTRTYTPTHTANNCPHPENIPAGTEGLQDYVHFVGGPSHSLRLVRVRSTRMCR